MTSIGIDTAALLRAACEILLLVFDLIHANAPFPVQRCMNRVVELFESRFAFARRTLKFLGHSLLLLYLDYATLAPGAKYFHCTSFGQYLLAIALTLARRVVALLLLVCLLAKAAELYSAVFPDHQHDTNVVVVRRALPKPAIGPVAAITGVTLAPFRVGCAAVSAR